MGFKGIVGHEDIIAHFKSSIETGNVAHAYIISGDAGSGKKALAYAFAETLECEAGGTEACGRARERTRRICIKAALYSQGDRPVPEAAHEAWCLRGR